jgi:endonuclease IV
MKFKQDSSFPPVTITLQSLDEVERLFVVLNHAHIFDAVFSDIKEYHALHSFLEDIVEDYELLHKKLCNKLKKMYGKG